MSLTPVECIAWSTLKMFLKKHKITQRKQKYAKIKGSSFSSFLGKRFDFKRFLSQGEGGSSRQNTGNALGGKVYWA